MPPLFVASSERLIEVYGTYDFIILVRRLGKFSLQEIFLCGQNFQIFSVSVLHQELCVPDSCLEIEDLLLVKLHALLGCLPESECVVYLHSGIQKALPEAVCGLLHLRLCCSQACLVGSSAEDRLCKTGDEVGDDAARVHGDVSAAGCPSECAAEGYIRIERCFG